MNNFRSKMSITEVAGSMVISAKYLEKQLVLMTLTVSITKDILALIVPMEEKKVAVTFMIILKQNAQLQIIFQTLLSITGLIWIYVTALMTVL